MSALSDAIITYAILRKFTTPFTETPAFKLGLIDENGVPTYKSRHDTSETNRDAYTLLDRLVFKLKRNFKAMPAFSKLIGGYASGLAFIKESTDLNEFKVFEDIDSFHADYWGCVLLGESIVSYEDHVIVHIAEDSSLLARLVEAYEKGIQDSVCEEIAASVTASGNSVGSGQVQGLATEPVITKKKQKEYCDSNSSTNLDQHAGRKIEGIL